MFIPGMFICICGEGLGVRDVLVAGIRIPGIFIPGILPVCFWFAEFFCAGVFFLLDADLRRCIGIFMPGMFIPGMLPMSCFFVVRLFPCAALFFLTAVFRFALALGFGIFIPGMFCMSLPFATALTVDVSIRPIMMIALSPHIRMKAPRVDLFMV